MLQCPACQSPFDLPVINLTTNPLVLTALSSLPVATSSSTLRRNGTTSSVNPNEIKCEICETGSEEDAVTFCQECVQYFCAGCQRAHKRAKGTVSHEFVSIDAALNGKMKGKLAHCARHPSQMLNSYCGKCHEVVCAECAVENHDLHGVKKLEGIIEAEKEELEALIVKVGWRLQLIPIHSNTTKN